MNERRDRDLPVFLSAALLVWRADGDGLGFHRAAGSTEQVPQDQRLRGLHYLLAQLEKATAKEAPELEREIT